MLVNRAVPRGARGARPPVKFVAPYAPPQKKKFKIRPHLPHLSHEVYQSRRLIDRTKEKDDVVPCTLQELAKFLEPYKLAFQELYRLACIALTFPVSSASCERSFSAYMKLIKSHLRSTMCDSRLSDIAVLSIESSRAESLSLDARHQNRKLALH